jgi:hypothetical protein
MGVIVMGVILPQKLRGIHAATVAVRARRERHVKQAKGIGDQDV